jgi:hypothetical protein
MTLPSFLDRAEEARDLGHHGLVVWREQHRGHGKVVVGEEEAEQAGGDDARPHHRNDDAAEGLEARAAIDHGAFVEILGDRQEEGVQHPQREGLVDGDKDDDRRGQTPQMLSWKNGSR